MLSRRGPILERPRRPVVTTGEGGCSLQGEECARTSYGCCRALTREKCINACGLLCHYRQPRLSSALSCRWLAGTQVTELSSLLVGKETVIVGLREASQRAAEMHAEAEVRRSPLVSGGEELPHVEAMCEPR